MHFTIYCPHLTRVQSESDTSALVCGMFRAFTAVMEQSAEIREGFEVRMGYTILSEVVSDLITPTTAILQEALNMVRYECLAEELTCY